MRASAAERETAVERLRAMLPPGSTVYTVLRHVSRSGMSRAIDVYVLSDGDPLWVSRRVSTVTGIAFDAKREALRVGGCGMDMGFHVVYELSHYLYPNGFGCIGDRCPANDHANGDRDYTPHGCTDENGRGEDRDPYPGERADGCVRHWHRSGGYALRQRWL